MVDFWDTAYHLLFFQSVSVWCGWAKEMEFAFSIVVLCRNLVSASQDGKLIVWDGYTTNKVSLHVTFDVCFYTKIFTRPVKYDLVVYLYVFMN